MVPRPHSTWYTPSASFGNGAGSVQEDEVLSLAEKGFIYAGTRVNDRCLDHLSSFTGDELSCLRIFTGDDRYYRPERVSRL